MTTEAASKAFGVSVDMICCARNVLERGTDAEIQELRDGLISAKGAWPMPLVGAFVLSIILVAFATAIVVNLWDWARRKVSGIRPLSRDGGEAAGEQELVGRASGSPQEPPQVRQSRRIGEEPR